MEYYDGNSITVLTSSTMLCSRGSVVLWKSLDEVLAFKRKNNNAGTVLFSMSALKAFMLQLEKDSTLNFPAHLCLCEVVLENSARLYLDFDGDVLERLDDISSAVRHYLRETYNVECVPHWKWSDGDEGKRWHCVIAGAHFVHCWIESAIALARYIVSTLRLDCVDMGVYRTNSALRMIGQFKYKHGIYCRKLHPHVSSAVSCFSINPSADDVVVDTTLHNIPRMATDRISIGGIVGSFSIPRGLELHRMITGYNGLILWSLRRIFPSMCIICNRVHDRVGAYIMQKHVGYEYRCYRDNTKCVTFDHA